MKKILIAFLLITTLIHAQQPKKREPIKDPGLLYLGAGLFNIVRNTKSATFQLEYRPNLPIYRNHAIFIRPLIGAIATSQGSAYFYGGLAFDLFIAKEVVFTPSFAPGGYFKGGGLDLGFPLEFRTCLELSYRFKNKGRLGAMFYHISNASIGSRNPGAECLSLFYAIPLGSSK